jgi:branched-chain amino acid transport system permease protein
MTCCAEFIEYSLLGLLSGGVLSLMAMSFVLIYKGTGVVNFAVGEIMLVGTYAYYSCRVLAGLPVVVSIVLALTAVAALALTIEQFILRPLAGQPTIAVLMATIGVSSFLHGFIEAVWGADTFILPQLLPRAPYTFGDVLIPGTAIWNFAVAAGIVAAFGLFFGFTRAGIKLRASASDPITASTVGINISYAQRLSWILSGLVGTSAGILISGTSGLSPLLSSAALGVFAILILGGLDSLTGAVVASLIVGLIDSLVVGYVGGKARDVVPYIVVLAVLVVRPYGLLGTRTIERL